MKEGENMDEKQIEKMLNMAAAKLGMSPKQLKKAAIDGNTEQILSHLDKSKADKVRSVMNNKQMTENILKSIKNNDNN